MTHSAKLAVAALLVSAFAAGPAYSEDTDPYCPITPSALAARWTGTYRAEENIKAKGFAPQTMQYQAQVIRDDNGVLRATISIDGHLTMRRMKACGEAQKHQLILRLLEYSEEDHPKVGQINHPVLTLEQDGPQRWMMGFPEVGSYLRNKPFIPATRLPNPK